MSFENKGSFGPTVTVSLDPDRSGNFVCSAAEAHEITINRAISHVATLWGGGVVHLKAGTFTCTSYAANGEILMRDNVTLEGEGPDATIIQAPLDTGDNQGVIDNVNHGASPGNVNIVIRDLKIDGRYDDGNGTPVTREPSGITLNNVRNSLVERVHVVDCLNHGIKIGGTVAWYSENVTIRDCWGSTFGNRFIGATPDGGEDGGCRDINIINCFGTHAHTCFSVHGCYRSGFIDCTAYDNDNTTLYPVGGTCGFELGGFTATKGQDCFMYNCVANDNFGQGVILFSTLRPIVVGNKIMTSSVGISVEASAIYAHIADNWIHSCMTGIEVDGTHYTVEDNVLWGGVWTPDNYQVGISVTGNHALVSGNLIYDWGTTGAQNCAGIRIYGSDHSQVENNYVYDSESYVRSGISVQNSDYVTVKENYIYGINYGAGSDAIKLDDTADYCVIEANTMNTCNNGIEIATAACDGNMVHGNKFFNIATALMVDSGTGTIFDSLVFQFTEPLGTATYKVTTPTGIEVDAVDEGALLTAHIPREVNQTMQFRVTGVGLAPPGAGKGMLLEININAGKPVGNEAYNAEAITCASVISTEDNFAANDAVEWVITASDDTDVDEITGGETIECFALFENDGENGDIATDALIRALVVEYV